MTPLTKAEVMRLRAQPGRAMALFLTDRCPVGCAHCSVDSRADSPTIQDFSFFERLLEGVCAISTLKLVAITGGEPFVERRGLILAIDRLVEAGKLVSLFTSGVWSTDRVPEWIRSVIRKASNVFLSTDAFHADGVDDAAFIKAARVIADEGVWTIVQVLDDPAMVSRAEVLAARALGPSFRDHLEIAEISALPRGRGSQLFSLERPRPARAFRGCAAMATPVLRYDGRMSACCNESVIMGAGPDRLRIRCARTEDVALAHQSFLEDPLLRMVRSVGVGALSRHPRFAEVANGTFRGGCAACWSAQDRAEALGETPDRLLRALALSLEPTEDKYDALP